jgi:hypothetical protein
MIHPQRPGGGRNPPQRLGERSGHLQWPFLSLRRTKKKFDSNATKIIYNASKLKPRGEG